MKKRYRVLFSSRKDFDQTVFLVKYFVLPALLIVAVLIAMSPSTN